MRGCLTSLACLAAATVAAAPAHAADGGDIATWPDPWTAGYQPQPGDEAGLWQQSADYEDRLLRHSRLVIVDPALNAYVRQVLCHSVGDAQCAPLRLYIVRDPSFNAAMMPNGAMMVNSGLLMRVNNEAELATVLAHEFTHFADRHSLRSFRDMRTKTDIAMLAAFVPYVGGLGQFVAIGAIFDYSRDMEREADVGSIHLIAGVGYAPDASPAIWRQLYDESEARSQARHRRNRESRSGFFSTHPATPERFAYLTDQAHAIGSGGGALGRDAYRAALASWWPLFIDDQIKLNDFGGTEYLLQQRARDGWTPEMLYARGELYRTRGQATDFTQAADFYRQAIAAGTEIPECWRGLGLALLRGGGDRAEATAAIQTYLQKKPDAGDRAMMLMMIGGQG